MYSKIFLVLLVIKLNVYIKRSFETSNCQLIFINNKLKSSNKLLWFSSAVFDLWRDWNILLYCFLKFVTYFLPLAWNFGRKIWCTTSGEWKWFCSCYDLIQKFNDFCVSYKQDLYTMCSKHTWNNNCAKVVEAFG